MQEQELVRHLFDKLLPGGAGFPSAASTACAALVTERLRHADPLLPAKLVAALTGRGEVLDWIAAAARLEAVEPALFGEFRKYAYLTYYEQPAVIAAIRALGHPYNDSPLPDGYPDDPFDPTRDAPRHGRGGWLDTGDVRPVDISALDLPS